MSTPLLEGKTALVTGASRGLGRHIAEAFWAAGADVFVVARSRVALETVCGDLREKSARGQRLGYLAVDLASPNAPEVIFDSLQQFSERLYILVNNAAIIGPIGPLAENDWPSWQETLHLNLAVPVALSRLALRRMKSHQRGGVVINISGGGATGPRPFFSAYATAKAGLVRFTETVAAETWECGIRVNAIAPGAMNTEMQEAVRQAGPSLAGGTEYRQAMEHLKHGGTSPTTPADLAVFLASDAAAGITGRLISAVWDPWKTLPDHAAELAKSDIYTLRRIVPEDRGLRWA
jgi:3-oxoacyl-[acyl-carrier protein] reductase